MKVDKLLALCDKEKELEEVNKLNRATISTENDDLVGLDAADQVGMAIGALAEESNSIESLESNNNNNDNTI